MYPYIRIIVFTFLLLFISTNANAYIDPSPLTTFLSILIAYLVAFFGIVGTYIIKITNFFKKNFSTKIIIAAFFIFILYTFINKEIYKSDSFSLNIFYYLILLFLFIIFFFKPIVRLTIIRYVSFLYFILFNINLFYPFIENFLYENKIINNYLMPNEYYKFQKIKKINSKLNQEFLPSYYLGDQNYLSYEWPNILPLSLPSNTNFYDCFENNDELFYKTDIYGFNNPNTNWKKKNKTFLIGNSFGIGSCVNNYNVSTIINNKNKKFNIINISFGGNGPLIQYATYVEYAKSFDFKNLIWMYYDGNDVKGIDSEKKNHILMNYINEINYRQNLLSNPEVLEEIKYDYNFLYQKNSKISYLNPNKYENKLLIYNFITLYNLRYHFGLMKEYNRLKKNSEKIKNYDDLLLEGENLIIFKKIFKNIYKDSKKKGFKIYFVFIPSTNDIKNNRKSLNKDIIYNVIKNKNYSSNIEFIDFENVILNNKSQKKVLQLPTGHFTKEGYSLLANSIYENIFK